MFYSPDISPTIFENFPVRAALVINTMYVLQTV